MKIHSIKLLFIALITAVLCLVCAAGLAFDRPEAGASPAEAADDAPIGERLAFVLDGGDPACPQTIYCIPDGDMLYVYLPSCAETGRVKVALLTSVPLYLDGTRLRGDMTCEAFPVGEPLELSGDGLAPAKLTFLASANVATLFVETASGSMDAVHEDKARREEARLALYDADGACGYRTLGTDEIRGRGQSSWNKVKKGYNLYLDYSADLFAMGKAKKWALIPNLVDESNLRNWFAYTLADRVSPYSGFAPQFAYVDLYLNGRYNGLYMLCEKIEIHPSRLDIGSDSWLFDIDLTDRMDAMKNAFKLGGGLAVEIKTPAVCTEEQKQWLRDRLLAFQAALLSEDGIDPQTGMAWSDFIDLDSFARKYLIEEIVQNYDAGSCSQFYFWNAADGRIYAGPCWDYDYSLGNYWQKTPNCFLARREWKTPKRYTPWFYGLWQKAEFRDRVVALYREEFTPVLQALVATELPRKADELEAAVALNALRWREYYAEGTVTGDLDYTLDYLDRHIAFLDSAWIDGVDYKTITLKLNAKDPYQFFCLPAGSTCESLPPPSAYWLKGDQFWCLENGLRFDPSTVLDEDMLLVASGCFEGEG